MEALEDFRQAHHNIDIFHTVWSYAEPTADSAFHGPFYLDLDSDNLDAALQDARNVARFMTHHLRISEHSVQVFFTGKKGFNILVDAAAFSIRPCPHLHRIWKALASDLHTSMGFHTIDLKVYDRRRLLRFANSIHGDTGLYKIPLTAAEIFTLSTERIVERAQSPQVPPERQSVHPSPRASAYLRTLLRRQKRRRRAEAVKPPPEAYLDEPPCIKALLAGVGEGERNQALFSLACFYHQQGLSMNQILMQLEDWNACNTPALPEQELRCSIASAVKGIYKLGCSSPSLKERCDPGCSLFSRR